MITFEEKIIGMHTYEKQRIEQLVALDLQGNHRPASAIVSSEH